MRVTDRIKYDAFKTNLGLVKERIDKAQNMIASGRKILTPSDDPVAASIGIQLKTEINLNDQYKKNLDSLKTQGSFYDTSINSIHELLTRAKEVAVTQSSDTMNASTRASSSEEIKGMIEQLVTLGNTKVGNTYIFGGKKSNTVPFSMDADYNVTFNGSSEVSSVYIDKNTKEAAGISGERVFTSGVNIPKVLKDFKDALEQNDVGKIREALDDVNESLDKTEINLAYVGTYTARIDSLIADKDLWNGNFTEVLSKMMDTDIAQAMTDFNSLSTAYQAMLYTISKIQDLTVLNYLR